MPSATYSTDRPPAHSYALASQSHKTKFCTIAHSAFASLKPQPAPPAYHIFFQDVTLLLALNMDDDHPYRVQATWSLRASASVAALFHQPGSDPRTKGASTQTPMVHGPLMAHTSHKSSGSTFTGVCVGGLCPNSLGSVTRSDYYHSRMVLRRHQDQNPV